MHTPNGNGRDRAHIGEEPAPWRRFQNTAFAVDDLFNLRRIREHGNDDICVPYCLSNAICPNNPMGEKIIHSLATDVVGANGIACLE
jgi:hypothetical protein